MKIREYSFDFLRFIAIVGVIAIHSSDVFIIFVDTNWNFHFGMFLRQLLNFSVPLFLFISGYFMSQTVVEKKYDYLIFLKKRIPRVFIPYLFWSMIIIILSIILTERFDLKSSLTKFLTFSTNPEYYYVALIIQFYFLTPFLQKISNKRGIIIIAILNLLFLMILYFLTLYINLQLPFIVYNGLFFYWWIFYQLGIYYGKNKENFLIKPSLNYLLIFLTYLISVAESYLIYFQTNKIGAAISALKISSFLFSFCIINYLFTIRSKFNREKSLLIKIGIASYGIYLVHVIVLKYLIVFLIKIGVIINYQFFEIQPLFQFISIFLTITICMIINLCCKKIFPEIIWKKTFGF